MKVLLEELPNNFISNKDVNQFKRGFSYIWKTRSSLNDRIYTSTKHSTSHFEINRKKYYIGEYIISNITKRMNKKVKFIANNHY